MSKQPAEPKVSSKAAAAAPGPVTSEAMADIAHTSTRLAQLWAERLRADDNYQVVDPRTVAETFLEFARTARLDEADAVKRQLELGVDMARLWQQTAARLLRNEPTEPVIAPAASDKRFKSELWEQNAWFDWLKQSYLLASRHVQSTVDGVEGVDPHTHHKFKFYTRQFLNALSPANFPTTNPVVLDAAMASRGETLVKGLRNLLQDVESGGGRLRLRMADLSAFRFGENIAASPGKVVFQNELMQLIQYTPTTETVHRHPLLIIPPWINKFYILDLKPKNSFIKWCTDQGHTVFVISWVNPGPELAAKEFADYLLQGPLTALDAIERATGENHVNTVGYCIGGTLTATMLAYMAATRDDRIASATLFTTLLDYEDVGDISVFIDDEQLALADDHMQKLGYLEGRHMAEAFNLLRENDLIWSFVVNNYLLGKDPAAFDLLYWNSDSTRMPAAMQIYYLRNMYNRNVLKEPGGLVLANVPIDLRRIETPLYFLSTREDHIAPWHSTYAGTRLVSGPVRFVLGASGHVAGVINPPAANKYGYWTGDRMPDAPQAWLDGAVYQAGSWWTDWNEWVGRNGGGKVAARQPGQSRLPAIESAPGSYVQVRAA